ncbi:hypothetical protein [Ferruginibacter sp.]
MKTTTNKLGVTMSKEELEVITKEVKETLAFDYLKQNKHFGSVDLWNIQRRRKGIHSRRMYV